VPLFAVRTAFTTGVKAISVGFRRVGSPPDTAARKAGGVGCRNAAGTRQGPGDVEVRPGDVVEGVREDVRPDV